MIICLRLSQAHHFKKLVVLYITLGKLKPVVGGDDLENIFWNVLKHQAHPIEEIKCVTIRITSSYT